MSEQQTPFLIATRNSKLALWQAEWVKAKLSHFDQNHTYKLLPMVSTGDLKLNTMLALVGGKGLFTAELEQALKEGRAICAVHSLKDVPMNTEDCYEWVYTSRGSVEDVVIFPTHSSYQKIEDLPPGSVIGTSSVRRQALIAYHFPHLKVKILRGNVQTRLEKLNNPENGYAAILLAKAGIERLELIDELRYQKLSHEFWTPAPGQGIVTIQYLKGSEFEGIARFADNNTSRICQMIERGIARELGGSCSLPLGVHLSFTSKHHTMVSARVVSQYEEQATEHFHQDPYDQNLVEKFELDKIKVDVFMADLENINSIKFSMCEELSHLELDHMLTLTPRAIEHIENFVHKIVGAVKADKFNEILASLETQIQKFNPKASSPETSSESNA